MKKIILLTMGLLICSAQSWAKDYPNAAFNAFGDNQSMNVNYTGVPGDKAMIIVNRGWVPGGEAKETYQITIDTQSHKILAVETQQRGQPWVEVEEDQYRKVFLTVIDTLTEISKQKDFWIDNIPGGPAAGQIQMGFAGFEALARKIIRDLKEDPRFEIPFAVDRRGKLPVSLSGLKSGKVLLGGKNEILIQQRQQRYRSNPPADPYRQQSQIRPHHIP